jgi:uncharacterized protein
MNRPLEPKKRERNLLGRFFPEEYDFEAMLSDQADRTVLGVRTFLDWLRGGGVDEPKLLDKMEADLDEMRHDMEEKLKDAFSTPFDRQDIYSLSRQIDYVLNYTKETAREMYTFEVGPDDAITSMGEQLLQGVEQLALGVKALRADGTKVRKAIGGVSEAAQQIDEIYILSMDRAFRNDDPMGALKKREVYHHLRDAGRTLRLAKDALHRSVVGLN